MLTPSAEAQSIVHAGGSSISSSQEQLSKRNWAEAAAALLGPVEHRSQLSSAFSEALAVRAGQGLRARHAPLCILDDSILTSGPTACQGAARAHVAARDTFSRLILVLMPTGAGAPLAAAPAAPSQAHWPQSADSWQNARLMSALSDPSFNLPLHAWRMDGAPHPPAHACRPMRHDMFSSQGEANVGALFSVRDSELIRGCCLTLATTRAAVHTLMHAADGAQGRSGGLLVVLQARATGGLRRRRWAESCCCPSSHRPAWPTISRCLHAHPLLHALGACECHCRLCARPSYEPQHICREIGHNVCMTRYLRHPPRGLTAPHAPFSHNRSQRAWRRARPQPACSCSWAAQTA